MSYYKREERLYGYYKREGTLRTGYYKREEALSMR